MPLMIPVALIVFFVSFFFWSVFATPADLLSPKLAIFFCWWATGYLCALCIASAGAEMSSGSKGLKHVFSAFGGILGPMLIASVGGYALITLGEFSKDWIYNREHGRNR